MELDVFLSKVFAKYFKALFVLILISFLESADAQKIGEHAAAALVKSIDWSLEIPDLHTGWQGIYIERLRDSKVLYQHEAHHVFLPASNNKILTSAVALANLGADFRYHTQLRRNRPILKNGTLKGDLILIGSGDPLLSPADLKSIAKETIKAGIKRVSGAILYDDTLFDHQRYGDTWAWDDMDFYYSAQISALNLNENMVFLQPHPGKKKGDPVRFDIGPVTDYANILNSAVTGGAGTPSTLNISRQLGLNTILVTGTIPLDIKPDKNLPVGVTIDNPSRYAAYVLKKYLERDGVRVHGGILESKTSAHALKLVSEHVSEPLSVILKKLNKPSDNLVAECLLKTVGAKLKKQGTGGESGTGAQAAREWFKLIGMDISELNQADGSGLSRTNYVSPANIVKLLVFLHSRPDFSVFFDSLPIAGVDGSLRNRMKDTPAFNNCHAKTGYVSHASSLSGYVTNKDGDIMVFSILMNNHLCPNKVCTQIQDKIVNLLANYTE